MGTKKNILFAMRQAPYGCSLAKEGLDALLACAIFDQNITVLFMNDGVYQLCNSQAAEKIHKKSFEKSLKALPLYGVENIYVEKESLDIRQLSVEDLSLPAALIEKKSVGALFQQQHTIFQF